METFTKIILVLAVTYLGICMFTYASKVDREILGTSYEK